MMADYTPRYPGLRWTLSYGSLQGVRQFAVEELHRALQYFLPYVMEVVPAQQLQLDGLADHAVLVGTPQDNPLIAGLLQRKLIDIPDAPEGYTLASFPMPWNPGLRLLVIAGKHAQGVLYGVEDLCAHTLAKQVMPDKLSAPSLHQALDGIGDFSYPQKPRVAQRGIWTWGYVIYDYRLFLDAMARLRLNLLTIWNDVPPLNCQEVIRYAHSRGVRVFLGFPWGWGMDFDLAKASDRERIRQMVLDHYRTYLAPLQPDGIYFQTLTEHDRLELGGRSVASLTRDLVNQVSSGLFDLNPSLQIHFGLHATSIGERFPDLAGLDSRISIVWEDAGVLPYMYNPVLDPAHEQPPHAIPAPTFEETLAYSQQLATFRPGTPFAMIAKGWTSLDWGAEFEHHKPYWLGLRSAQFRRQRLEQIQPRWDRVNSLWIRNYPYAVRFYRQMLETAGGYMSVSALIEDGLLEERIQPSAALFAETLWDPFQEAEDLLAKAYSPYYSQER